MNPKPDTEDIRAALTVLSAPGHAIEVRAPEPLGDDHFAVVSRFAPGDVCGAAAEAARLSGRYRAVYVVLNGTSPDLPVGVALRKIPGSDRGVGSVASDIPRRLRLLFDVDPVRPADTNATEAEKAAAFAIVVAIRDELTALGWPEPTIADSGNGYHLLYDVELPNDDASTALAKGVLTALAERFDTALAAVDRVVFDAPRLVKLYGTWACKGDDTPERPGRISRIISVPAERVPVPRALLEAIAAEAPVPGPPLDLEAEIARKRAAAGGGFRVPTEINRPDVESRAVAYLDRCEPAVSGQPRGHDKAFKAACKVGPGFDLPAEVAFRLLMEHYNPRCEPLWSEKEMRHKVDDAYSKEPRRGWLRDAPPKNGHPVGANGDGTRAATGAVNDKDDDSDPVDFRSWPDPPDSAVFHGLAGEIVKAIEPHTEADQLGLLAQVLILFGNLVGRSPHYTVESTRHHANENAVLVGPTAQGRKGTSADRVKDIFLAVDAAWVKDRIKGGLSSGEGLISAVRDPVWAKQPVKEKGRVVDYETVMVDEGVADKRLLILETEFGGALRALEREGNKLSALMRQAWDNGNLATLTKSPFKATDAHISVVGHITADELLALLSGLDAANGFANRFLWLAVRRSKVLPFGGSSVDLAPFTGRLTEAVEFARQVGRMQLSAKARCLWERHYERLTSPPPGVLGAVTSRAAPHTIRLAMLYALLDRTAIITDDHLRAALALWDASARCAAFIFGDSLGNADAEKILAALRTAPEGLTRSEIRERVFQRNASAERIKRALEVLLRHHLAREERDDATGGRPAYRYYAINAVNAKSPPPEGGEAESAPPYRVNGVNGVRQGSDDNAAGADREVFEL